MSRLAARLAPHLCVLLLLVALMAVSTSPARADDPGPQLTCPSCEDYDACTIDSCDTATGACRHDQLNCDDGNQCTKDSCIPFGVPSSSLGCHHVPLSAGSACDDGKPCTAADACDGSGACAGAPQVSGSACDDGNTCTTADRCDADGTCSGTALAQGAECDDRNACTLGERCVANSDGSVACRGDARSCDDGNLCTTDSCDPITGDCTHATHCDDGNECTTDTCDPATGVCAHAATSGTCEDGNVCTVNDACVDGNCVGGGAWDCGYGTQCGSVICGPIDHRCFPMDNPARCPPPGDCGNHFECRNGFCAFVQGSTGQGSCTDGNPCTIEMCVRGGCATQLMLTGTACSDGNACTTGDICQNGRCIGTSPCSDGDACTDDLCDTATGLCLGHTASNCDDGNPCTTDSCDSAAGCQHTPNTDACDDHNACTTNDRCGNGLCQGAPAVVCSDDGNICTDDYCNPATGGCVHPNNFFSCEDGNPCTVGDRCMDGSCHAGTAKFCDDSNVCTSDACDPTSGACVHGAVNGSCNDGNACTAGDTCVAGACRSGTPLNCDDGNSCTSDGCSTFSGCYHFVITGACDDGNPCTTGDTCVNGVCLPQAPVSCIDGNACTIDHCDRATGACVHDASGGECDDGNACTVDLCDPSNGSCLGHEALDCDDGNPCTSDSCDPGAGCAHVITCPQDIVDLSLSFDNPAGKGSGTMRWRSLSESTLSGFNIVLVDNQGGSVQINAALIPCKECLTGLGATYAFILPKHRSGHGIYVETIGVNGGVLGRFGPADKTP